MIAVLEAPAKCARCGKGLIPGESARVYGNRVYGECCRAVPLDGNLWEEALKVAKRLRWKADPEDRDDLVQDIVLKCAEVAKKRDGLTEASLWVIARYVVFHYWRDKARRPTMLSLEREPAGDGLSLGETIAARDVDLGGLLDLKEWLKGCPPGIIRIARKKLNGERLTQQEHDYWWKYRRRRGTGPARPKHLLDPFAGTIKDMMGKVWEPHRILEELRAQGYRGSLSTLYSYLQRLNGAVPCPQCGCLFTHCKAHTKYCSSECQRKRVRRAHQVYLARRYHEDPAYRVRRLERGRRQRARGRAPAAGIT